MNKKSIFKTVSNAVNINRFGNGYVVIVPFYDKQPNGPTTQINTNSYSEAVQIARIRKIHLAAILLCDENNIELDFEDSSLLMHETEANYNYNQNEDWRTLANTLYKTMVRVKNA